MSILSKKRHITFELRIRRGLPAVHIVPVSHREIVDETTGRPVRLEPNPEMLPVWDDLATLILEGLSWIDLTKAMAKRFGHVNPEGKPYAVAFFRGAVFNPVFWGNSAYHLKPQRHGLWVFDEGAPVPNGITIYYNTHQPVWTGDLAERIKAELRRRHDEPRAGDKLPDVVMLTDLFKCGECGRTLILAVDGMWLIWRCRKHGKGKSAVRITDRHARKYVARHLREMFTPDAWDAVFPDRLLTTEELAHALRTTQTELEKTAAEIQRLYQQLTETTGESATNRLKSALVRAYEGEETLQTRQQELHQQSTFIEAFGDLTDVGEVIVRSVDEFWRLPAQTVNGVLRRLMGKQRFVVLNGEIMGMVENVKSLATHSDSVT